MFSALLTFQTVSYPALLTLLSVQFYVIITEIGLLLKLAPDLPKWNWKKADWNGFIVDLEPSLHALGEPTKISTHEELKLRLTNLDSTLAKLVETHVPTIKPSPYA